jgi:CRISPR-associated endonuclease Cas1
MAASQTVHQLSKSRNPNDILPTTCSAENETILRPRHGVATLFGYGIKVCVDRGHLILKDGIGPNRQAARLPRVGHGLRRLVVIGSDGLISLAALRWLADQDASFVMLDRRGFVLATTGPVRPPDSRLRRAQALALESGAALRVVRELIGQKLAGQERLVREKLCNSATAKTIAEARSAVAETDSIEAIHLLETQGAGGYWSAWHNLPVPFPTKDIHRVPDHWRTFGTRRSPLTKSPRLAVNPPNAILNYLYALLESEARLAAASLGLDPGLGFLHKDTQYRDSLACDLMEPIRPQVDAFLLDWMTREPLRREWFFEERDGNCRLMGPFAAHLSETAPAWARAVAPVAESIVRTLWSSKPKPARRFFHATPLTQEHRREVKGKSADILVRPAPRPPAVCRICGASIRVGPKHCARCAATLSKVALIEAARVGRVTGHSPDARMRQAEKQRRHAAELKSWTFSEHPRWLSEEFYREKIQPLLAAITVRVISSTLGISEPYAALIRAGRKLPHPRHWFALAQLAAVSLEGPENSRT